jgi:hypothetical protein
MMVMVKTVKRSMDTFCGSHPNGAAKKELDLKVDVLFLKVTLNRREIKL